MIVENSNVNTFIKKIIDIYKTICDIGMLQIPTERIELLTEYLKDNSIAGETVKNKESFLLNQYIFDALILTFASNSKNELKIEDPNLLGRARDLKNLDKAQQLDWFFQMTIQSWLEIKGSGPIKDLKTSYKSKVCEYYFEKESVHYLVECKHLNNGNSTREDSLYEKIRSKISQNQLGITEGILNENATKLMFIDISEYINSVYSFTNDFYNIQIQGPTDQYIKELDAKIKGIIPIDNKKFDQLIICWNETIYMNSNPVVYSKKSLEVGSENNLTFNGISLETFPMKGKKGPFSETRFRTGTNRANYINEIITTLNSLTSPETFSRPSPA